MEPLHLLTDLSFIDECATDMARKMLEMGELKLVQYMHCLLMNERVKQRRLHENLGTLRQRKAVADVTLPQRKAVEDVTNRIQLLEWENRRLCKMMEDASPLSEEHTPQSPAADRSKRITAPIGICPLVIAVRHIGPDQYLNVSLVCKAWRDEYKISNPGCLTSPRLFVEDTTLYELACDSMRIGLRQGAAFNVAVGLYGSERLIQSHIKTLSEPDSLDVLAGSLMSGNSPASVSYHSHKHTTLWTRWSWRVTIEHHEALRRAFTAVTLEHLYSHSVWNKLLKKGREDPQFLVNLALSTDEGVQSTVAKRLAMSGKVHVLEELPVDHLETEHVQRGLEQGLLQSNCVKSAKCLYEMGVLPALELMPHNKQLYDWMKCVGI